MEKIYVCLQVQPPLVVTRSLMFDTFKNFRSHGSIALFFNHDLECVSGQSLGTAVRSSRCENAGWEPEYALCSLLVSDVCNLL